MAFIGLPCAGKLDTDVLLKALALGADGVLVLACPEENCRSNHGNSYARDRLAEARNYLEEAGIDGRRLRFENISSNRVYLLNEVLQDFTDIIKSWRGGHPRSMKIPPAPPCQRGGVKSPPLANRDLRGISRELD